MISFDQRLYVFAAKRLEPGERACLVQPHQPAVPHHIGGEDGDQLAFQMLGLFHCA
jgi:hypothetical protein